MHSFLCFSKIGFLHDIDLYLGSLSLEICDFDSKQLSLPVAISACRAAPMGANPLGHTFKPLILYDISIYTIYFSHPFRRHRNIEALDRAIVVSLIERILIFRDRRVEIVYRWHNEFQWQADLLAKAQQTLPEKEAI